MEMVYNKGVSTINCDKKYCTNVYYWNNKQIWR